MICMYIYIYISNHYISIYPKHIFLRYILYMTCFFSVSFISCRFFFGQYGTISRPNPSRSCTIPVSWSLGLWGSWHLGGKYVKHVKQIYILVVYIYIYIYIYIYMYVYVYIFIYGTIYIYIYNMYTLYIYIHMDDLITIVMGYLWNINGTLNGIQLRMG